MVQSWLKKSSNLETTKVSESRVMPPSLNRIWSLFTSLECWNKNYKSWNLTYLKCYWNRTNYNWWILLWNVNKLLLLPSAIEMGSLSKYAVIEHRKQKHRLLFHRLSTTSNFISSSFDNIDFFSSTSDNIAALGLVLPLIANFSIMLGNRCFNIWYFNSKLKCYRTRKKKQYLWNRIQILPERMSISDRKRETVSTRSEFRVCLDSELERGSATKKTCLHRWVRWCDRRLYRGPDLEMLPECMWHCI